ncbi:LysR family transcriptional regulator [Halomonas sp. McH1-25]|uniref:LysR family transcriptional regulator n=1 Tax=unclassified Halomonas TaxID=2609666 RepID=UPI001EF50657|nr:MULTISPECIES: LysR family transcriptional regulator [unclassified Halomonas]MCG7600798.1 LysR family transcriptional regulator [Halomonas sp. McH1-25]MCP1342763.1 LysR family transcriptional regulator [Halomonas sp. FL8]MCP1362851.1 LysR family transcriptional regulator [Halomonas sp. BBD45]MCP1365497.1 LysR family transcriptional regulator [Halomonas sp. BBD48]
MDRFDSLALFTRIVETGSFTRAANGLEIPRATATLAIQQLEARLGARLLERTTRQVRPTPEGQAFYERCVHVLSELEEAEAAIKPIATNPRGVLRVEMHGAQAQQIVLPRIQEFRRRYPRLDVVLTSGDRRVDLVGEGIDCALRAGVPEDSSLVARKLAELSQVICASPDYLSRAGYPCHPGELRDHQVVRFFSGSNAVDSTLDVIVNGRSQSFEAGGWMTVNDASSYVAAALNGCGLIQLPRFHVERMLECGELEEVLADWDKPALPLWAIYPQRRQLSPRVRVFIDWAAAVYGERFDRDRSA